uniref:Speckle-type POZ protein n=1 Tax=Lygus hesperus TaxID=30085 RepID=A0A146LWB8_LYGHE
MDTENPEPGFCFTWTVHNFSTKHDLVRSRKYIMSEGSEMETHWLLGMYPNVIGKDHDKYVSLYLSMESCNGDSIVVSYAISIINRKNVICKTRQDKSTFKSKHVQGFVEYVKRSELLDEDGELLVNDRLKIICEIRVVESAYKYTEKPKYERTNYIPVREAYNEYWQLYIDKRLVDTTITVKTTEFQVHRLVLAAHSQVFDSMFSHNMIESSTNRVTIHDCEPEVFAELLRFVYTKRVENVKEVARGLLICADKYDLEQLKKVCETSIGEELTRNNAVDILILADTHNSVRLKSKALDYISSHAWSITQSPAWSVMLHHPKLLNEVVISLAKLSVKTSRRMFEERRASGFFLSESLPKS